MKVREVQEAGLDQVRAISGVGRQGPFKMSTINHHHGDDHYVDDDDHLMLMMILYQTS